MAAKRYRVHRMIDIGVLVALPALGLLHHHPITWFLNFAVLFAILATSVLGTAWIVTGWAEKRARRIQGPRRKPPMIAQEAFITAQAMWVMAALANWPLTAYRLGEPTGFTWTLDGTGWSPLGITAVTLLGVVAIDAWTYWKHRALHTDLLFGFHRDHHRFRDPSAFAGFAVGPFEALWTFCPVLAVWHPQAVTWGPLYFALVIGFVLLNFYLHCGVEVRLFEALIPRLGLNTSAYHNIHHSHVSANFGEVAWLWDRLCKTRKSDRKPQP